ncbi:MAG: hypothetical protein K2O34_14510 [Acetatifactor sp.]|nr:hypothetical protein [Acetatifactor sp.]
MIQVSFYSVNTAEDVCHILERDLTSSIDIEQWMMKKIPSIRFDCMDFPHDLESFYDCYFESDEEDADAYRIGHLLKDSLKRTKRVNFQVNIVDAQLKYIKKIEL